MAANRTLHADLSKRVELIDEDDAGGFGFGLRKQIPYARGTYADKHLNEFGSAQTEEGNFGLTGDGSRQQRFPGARWPDEQNALGDLSTELRVLARGLEEFHDLAQLLRRLVHARNVGETDFDIVFSEDFGLAPRKRHHAALGPSNPPKEERPQRDE
jgi:hypothetical protein